MGKKVDISISSLARHLPIPNEGDGNNYGLFPHDLINPHNYASDLDLHDRIFHLIFT
ncbi:hypothetical protein J1N35_028608 [Gossypium stocksii]|uniref:Uncharacterized protein n=1 Tax=Gossypium stocksii TaxID=47602 RepID=A0A9D3ZRA3_9ROSI|nr:hypothetical protein J1N35_028608 [Gossypium stocksii]